MSISLQQAKTHVGAGSHQASRPCICQAITLQSGCMRRSSLTNTPAGWQVTQPARTQRNLCAAPLATQSGSPPSRPAKKKVKKMVDINGDVTKDLGNGMFSVKLENGVSVMAHLSGKIRERRIKVVLGDKVTVELSPYDLTRGRITYRFKPGQDPNAPAPGADGAAGAGPAAGKQ